MNSSEYYLSTNDVYKLTGALKKRCCECGVNIGKGPHWLLTCSDKGATIEYPTCEACHAQREEFCTEYFTPSQLLQDLEKLRSELSYDSARPWALLTNAISLLRQRQKGPAKPAAPPCTPTPLRGSRLCRGGFAPALVPKAPLAV